MAHALVARRTRISYHTPRQIQLLDRLFGVVTEPYSLLQDGTNAIANLIVSEIDIEVEIGIGIETTITGGDRRLRETEMVRVNTASGITLRGIATREVHPRQRWRMATIEEAAATLVLRAGAMRELTQPTIEGGLAAEVRATGTSSAHGFISCYANRASLVRRNPTWPAMADWRGHSPAC